MKIIPIISIEEKFLGIERIDWVVFLFFLSVVEFVKSLFKVMDNRTLYGAFGLFIAFEIFKRSLEKKEQSLFLVLFHNSRIPNIIIGTFWKRVFLGVKGEIDS